MKNLIIISTLCLPLLVCTNTANAQWAWGQPYSYNHASTAAEGYLTGRARLRAGTGRFLEGVGRYQIMNQDAYSRYLDNKVKSTQVYWQRKAIWAENNKRPTWPEREMHRLDMEMQRMAVLERQAEVEKKRQELIDKGIIKQKPFKIMGQEFKNSEEWQKSDLRQRVIAQATWRQHNRELEKQLEEERRQKAVEFGRMWSKMSWLQKERYGRMNTQQREEYKNSLSDPEWHKKQQDKRFYEVRPYLLPSAGKNGLPPNPWK